MKHSIAGQPHSQSFLSCTSRIENSHSSAPPSLQPSPQADIQQTRVSVNMGGLLICRDMGRWLYEIGDANVQLLQLDSDEWRGEEGLHGWVHPLGTSVLVGLSCIPVLVALGSAGQKRGA